MLLRSGYAWCPSAACFACQGQKSNFALGAPDFESCSDAKVGTLPLLGVWFKLMQNNCMCTSFNDGGEMVFTLKIAFFFEIFLAWSPWTSMTRILPSGSRLVPWCLGRNVLVCWSQQEDLQLLLQSQVRRNPRDWYEDRCQRRRVQQRGARRQNRCQKWCTAEKSLVEVYWLRWLLVNEIEQACHCGHRATSRCCRPRYPLPKNVS